MITHNVYHASIYTIDIDRPKKIIDETFCAGPLFVQFLHSMFLKMLKGIVASSPPAISRPCVLPTPRAH